MNTELLEIVAQHIERNPLLLAMDQWECGATACIAGWAARIGGIRPVWLGETGRLQIDELNSVCILLDIRPVRDNGQEIVHPLFFVEQWPGDYGSEFNHPDSNHYERATIAAARIRHFIATGE